MAVSRSVDEAPANANRDALVQQDLSNVMHPLVQHRALEKKQMVIVTAHDSTVVDADGREYLDGMSGLWCANIGYGRDELADVAAEQMRKLAYYPQTAITQPAENIDHATGLAPTWQNTTAENSFWVSATVWRGPFLYLATGSDPRAKYECDLYHLCRRTEVVP